MRKRPLIVVEWHDTSTNTNWRKENEDLTGESLKCFSVGWKLKSTHDFLFLTPMRTTDGQCTDRQSIPRGCIRSIRRVE